MRALTKIAGPKVLLGVGLASLVGMGVLFWLYNNASSRAAQAGQQAAQLRQDLVDQRQAVLRLERERERLQAAVTSARQERRAARERSDSARRDLDQLGDNDESVQDWADERVPSGVADRVREYARARDQDGSAEAGASD